VDQPRFADTGRIADHQKIAVTNPVAARELVEQGTVRPRGVQKSVSSTTAFRRNRAWCKWQRRLGRLLSHAVTSRSSIRPHRPSRVRSVTAEPLCISMNASAKPRPRMRPARGWVSIVSLFNGRNRDHECVGLDVGPYRSWRMLHGSCPRVWCRGWHEPPSVPGPTGDGRDRGHGRASGVYPVGRHHRTSEI
jgi:hypothetical protein